MIFNSVTTAFAMVLCDSGFKTHYCPKSLLGGLLADIESRGYEAMELKDIKKGAMDLPGMVMVDRPWEDMMIGEFKFSVPTQDFEIFLDKLRHAPLRKFSDGQEYFKIHGFYHCLVLMPDQKDRLLGLMNSMAAEVSRKADRADRDLMSRVQCLHEKGVLSK